MPFISKPERYGMNRRSARRTHAELAYLEGPDGREPAVGIFRGGYITALLPLAEAIRLSNQIIDAAERHEVNA